MNRLKKIATEKKEHVSEEKIVKASRIYYPDAAEMLRDYIAFSGPKDIVFGIGKDKAKEQIVKVLNTIEFANIDVEEYTEQAISEFIEKVADAIITRIENA